MHSLHPPILKIVPNNMGPSTCPSLFPERGPLLPPPHPEIFRGTYCAFTGGGTRLILVGAGVSDVEEDVVQTFVLHLHPDNSGHVLHAQLGDNYPLGDGDKGHQVQLRHLLTWIRGLVD